MRLLLFLRGNYHCITMDLFATIAIEIMFYRCFDYCDLHKLGHELTLLLYLHGNYNCIKQIRLQLVKFGKKSPCCR